MNNTIEMILQQYKEGALTLEAATAALQHDEPSVLNLGFANLSVQILRVLMKQYDNVIGTRASKDVYDKLAPEIPDAQYDELARMVYQFKDKTVVNGDRVIAVITAGTSDIPVAEEAALTAEIMGNKVERIYDVGVAGLHRLLNRSEEIRRANVCVVVAGMEGALASVVGGLVDKPVVAVPTSIGYGANFHGLSALLANSCAAGVSVVNIDNGFGAGRMADMINRMR